MPKTLTVHFAETLEPSLAVTVITAFPFDLAVIVPLASTVATLVLLEVHVTDLLVASDGATVAVNFNVSFIDNVLLVTFNDIELTITFEGLMFPLVANVLQPVAFV